MVDFHKGGSASIGATLSILKLFAKRIYNMSQAYLVKLDGVGPVDNRPSTDKLHPFVREKKEIKIKKIKCDT